MTYAYVNGLSLIPVSTFVLQMTAETNDQPSGFFHVNGTKHDLASKKVIRVSRMKAFF